MPLMYDQFARNGIRRQECPDFHLHLESKTRIFRLFNENFSLIVCCYDYNLFHSPNEVINAVIQMEKITKKEESVMNLYWQHGAMFVKDLLEFYNEPKPHINTLSTYVRSLETKGYLTHKDIGGSFQYYPAIGRQECGQRNIENIVLHNLNNSFMDLVSCLVHEEKISLNDLKKLIDQIENGDTE